MNSYFRVRLINVQDSLEESVTNLSFKFSATGLAEALAYSQPDLTYDPKIIDPRFHDLDIYFPEKPEASYFDAIKELDKNIQWQIFEEQNKDWLAEWKKGFEAFNLVGPFWVVPSWLKSPVSEQQTLLIDPGMAFGTGTHATTKMASAFLHKIAKDKSFNKKMSLLDVGTGTSILAMLATRLGFIDVTGIEIDPEARRVARENVALNKLENIRIRDEAIEELHSQYDVVVANIIDGVLIRIKQELFKSLRPGGQLFLTGILLEREDHFYENFIEDSGLKVVRRLENDEWVGYWLET